MIVLTGGTGTIGKGLINHLEKHSLEYLVLTRNKILADNYPQRYLYWEPFKNYPSKIFDLDITAIIHLSGFPVYKFYTFNYLKKMVKSRAHNLIYLIKPLILKNKKIPILISMSSIAIYNNYGLLKNITEKWELAAKMFIDFVGKVVILRTGIVLSPYGGIISLLKKFSLFLPFIPVPFNTHFLWIHYEDLNDIILRELLNKNENKKLKIHNAFINSKLSYKKGIEEIMKKLNRKRLILPILYEPPYEICEKYSISSIKYKNYDEALDSIFNN